MLDVKWGERGGLRGGGGGEGTLLHFVIFTFSCIVSSMLFVFVMERERALLFIDFIFVYVWIFPRSSVRIDIFVCILTRCRFFSSCLIYI